MVIKKKQQQKECPYAANVESFPRLKDVPVAQDSKWQHSQATVAPLLELCCSQDPRNVSHSAPPPYVLQRFKKRRISHSEVVYTHRVRST